jgi:hypothetical protein
MLFYWKIRYLDSRDKLFKDRELLLNTDSLDPVMKAAVEATYALNDSGRRAMLRYRYLFREERPTEGWRQFRGAFCVSDYFEDEASQELSYKRMAVVLTGDPQAEFFPPGTRPHDAEFWQAEKPPVHLDRISLSAEQLNILGYFTRDLREMLAAALFKNGPGSLSGPWADGQLHLVTAVSDEEIRSFVTIFRRLYMKGEPANFTKAVEVFASALGGHPVAKWVQATASEYCNALEQPPDSVPMLGPQALSFTRKRLIDVYLYTQYAHQPDAHRSRQFNECLAAVGGNRSSLTWLFLTAIWKCAIEFQNAGGRITEFYDRYCACHNTSPVVLASLRSDHRLGTLEKKEAQEARILREKAEEAAVAMWERAGRPEGGHAPFVDQALNELIKATGRTHLWPE